MITNNHIEYLKQELESENGYSHPWLYMRSNKYIEAHAASIRYASSSYVLSAYVTNLLKDFPWENRYKTLVQHGTFFSNLVFLKNIRLNAQNEADWQIALDLKNIPHEMANFEICYCWMDPSRYFSVDWRKVKEDVPFPSEKEFKYWHFIDAIYKKISSEHLPICDVETFMSTRL